MIQSTNGVAVFAAATTASLCARSRRANNPAAALLVVALLPEAEMDEDRGDDPVGLSSNNIAIAIGETELQSSDFPSPDFSRPDFPNTPTGDGYSLPKHVDVAAGATVLT